MAHSFYDLAFTPRVKAVQEQRGSRGAYARFEAPDAPARDRLGPDEAAFIARRDSCYLASVSETGWPYVQHRGGPAGFLRVLGETTIGFADFRGNRQYISAGNLAGDPRIALFLMDYANRARLKILGRARLVEDDPSLLERLVLPGYDARVERAVLIEVAGFDWNCSQHITRRFTETEVVRMLAHAVERIEALEAENAALKSAAAAP
jgi:predicted pyridoxine 5'-phosphate oxidase superfamily flavin-nucleotide-binding protein